MSSVEKIKDRLDISQVVSSYIKLEKAGSNYRARCPFHNEKTPSFFVSPVRGTYHCFGCNRGGDIFSFVEEIEGVDFKGALKVLADKSGVDLVYTNPKETDKKERLYGIMEDATIFFQINLTKNSDALKYLYKRGLKPKTLKEFRVGFAEDSWDSLYNFLKSKSYSDTEIENTGLIINKSSEGKSFSNTNSDSLTETASRGYYDRFRSRIMFPISDSAGRVVAFSGRIFETTNKGEDKSGNMAVGKYINSPATLLYDKSKILYGYNIAKSEMRKTDTCVLVEGQMDLLMTHQTGKTNTVALSGTALTLEQLTAIKRLASTIVLSFDSDQAGFSASGRSASLALQIDLNVKAIVLPDGLDPADIILKDEKDWDKLVSKATHIVNFYIEMIERQNLEQREFGLKVSTLVLPFVKLIKNKIDQEYFIGEIAKKINVSVESVRQELEKIKSESIRQEGNNDASNVPNEVFKQKNRYEVLIEQIVSILFWQKAEKKASISVDSGMEKLKDLLGGEEFERVINVKDKNKMIFNAEVYFGEEDNIQIEFDELFTNLHKEILKNELELTAVKLRDAETKKDNGLANSILKKFQELSKKINNF
jgi:DNA primase